MVNHSEITVLQNCFLWSTHNLFGLKLDSFAFSIKAFRTICHFSVFERLTKAHLVNISITHNKYLTLLLLEGNDPIKAKSAA